MAGFGIGNRTHGWPNLTEEENAYASWEAYTGKPIYDEEPGEAQECWPEHEFILVALRGDKSKSSDPSQYELCTKEMPHHCYKQASQFMMTTDAQPSSTKVTIANEGQVHEGFKNEGLKIQILKEFLVPEEILFFTTVEEANQKAKNCVDPIEVAKFVEYKGEETGGVFKEESSVVPINMRKVTGNDPCKEIPTPANSFGLEKKSSLAKKSMTVFDPGGLVQKDHSKGVNHNFKYMTRSEMQLEEVVMKDSIG